MTAEERVQGVVEFGFTERQARFLALVMRHAGVCVGRQYARFANVAHGGAKCNAFFGKLVAGGYAVASDCIHNRARLYHVHHRPLYRAISEPNSQWRRPVPAGRAIGRLMLLDAVLASPDLDWLTTRSERMAYITARAPALAPVRVPLTGCLIGIDPSTRAVLLYLATEPGADAFRAFLQAHIALLDRLPTWTLRIVFPRSFEGAYEAYQRVLHEELESPLHSATADALRRLFEHRRTTPAARSSPSPQAPLDGGSEQVDTARVTMLYGRWRRHGEAAFAGLASPAISEALETGAGRVECLVLPQTYRHLSPLVSQVGRMGQAVEKGVEKPATRGDHRSARSQPHTSSRATCSSTSSLL